MCEDYWLPGYLVGYVSSPYEVDDFVVCHGCAYAAMDEEDERRFLDEW